MSSKISVHDVVFFLILIIVCLTVIIRWNFHRISFNTLPRHLNPYCFEWQPADHRLSTTHECPNYEHINSLVWTYDGTGIMKYIQWIIIRKLGNIKITRLNNNCQITKQKYFSTNSTNDMFIQLYIISLSANLTYDSKCSEKIKQIATINVGRINQIYFKRKSINATIRFQQLDLMRQNYSFNFTSNVSLENNIEKANYIIKHFPSYFTNIPSIKWTLIDSEDLIKTDLIDCEKVLINLISLLGLNITTEIMKNILEYDSHHFIEDSTWWDQSEVAEHIMPMSIPLRSSTFTYSNDFYYLHGDRSFIQYLSDNRQCYNDGIFVQMQSETVLNRTSTDQPNRCLSKPFDCAFSDIYSFNDREQMYQQNNNKPLKCGFTISSIFDKVRNRYGRNHTCQTIIYTCITNCFDPLPEIGGTILPSFCFVALIDTRTLDAYKKRYSINNSDFKWDLINLGDNVTLFRVPPKSTETLKLVGQRMFPLAKWIIWLDGKGRINNIIEALIQAQSPMIGAHHPDWQRTSASEVQPTIGWLGMREAFSNRLNITFFEIALQEKEYKRDGFYSRSDVLNLKMYDIAVFLFRNHHPCMIRYFCGWHNEVNYFSHRGQLSVYYAAVRLNLTYYLQFLPEKFHSTVGHQSVC